MKQFVIIVAGGTGKRLGSDIPKQFINLDGTPILMHTLKAFWDYDKKINIILVLPSEYISKWKELCKKHKFIIPHITTVGGETRFHSVVNGLAHVEENDCLVAIHDGVRPLVKKEVIQRVFECAAEKGNAIPCIKINDSLRMMTENYSKPIDREQIRMIQTPQCFHSSLLKQAYQQEYDEIFTDDATVIENLGGKIYLVEGNIENIKITTSYDLIIAEALLKNKH